MDCKKAFLLILFLTFCSLAKVNGENAKRYVGSEVCKDCHEEQYENFTKYAKKAHSFQSILRVKKGLTQEELKGCYACHTTGYGEEGGFRSPEETPHLRDAGCEVCHGPGSVHVESQDPKDVKSKLNKKDCERCHNPERVKAFKFRPLIHGGAH